MSKCTIPWWAFCWPINHAAWERCRLSDEPDGVFFATRPRNRGQRCRGRFNASPERLENDLSRRFILPRFFDGAARSGGNRVALRVCLHAFAAAEAGTARPGTIAYSPVDLGFFARSRSPCGGGRARYGGIGPCGDLGCQTPRRGAEAP